MAEEFLVCGGSWWNSPRNLFSSSPCSLPSNDIGSFGWPTNDVITELKRSSDESDGSSSVVIQDVQNSVGISMPTESILHVIGSLPLSSSAATSNAWINHDLLRDSARSVDNYSDFLLDSSMNYRPQIDKDWNSNSKNFDDHESFGGDGDQPAVKSTSTSTSAECVTPGIPVTSQASDSYGYASSLLQTLFDADSQPQQPLLHQQTTMSTYSSSSATTANYQLDSNGFLPSLQHNNRLWNSTPASFLSSPPSQFLPPSSITNHKPNIHSTRDHKQHEQGKDSAAAVNKASNEPPFKRTRIETPSPLPTFKVRKEKLGDRITALQQLVSPFGKTDTASVLHEAIEYIRFLHDQVNALSKPYLKYGSPPVQRQQGTDKSKDEEGLTKDLKTRGLCLVPISSTFPVAAETTSDFWTPTFGGGSSFR